MPSCNAIFEKLLKLWHINRSCQVYLYVPELVLVVLSGLSLGDILSVAERTVFDRQIGHYRNKHKNPNCRLDALDRVQID